MYDIFIKLSEAFSPMALLSPDVKEQIHTSLKDVIGASLHLDDSTSFAPGFISARAYD